jgi:hypothetical protein
MQVEKARHRFLILEISDILFGRVIENSGMDGSAKFERDGFGLAAGV